MIEMKIKKLRLFIRKKIFSLLNLYDRKVISVIIMICLLLGSTFFPIINNNQIKASIIKDDNFKINVTTNSANGNIQNVEKILFLIKDPEEIINNTWQPLFHKNIT